MRKAIKLKDEAKNGKKTYGCEVVHKFKERHDKKQFNAHIRLRLIHKMLPFFKSRKLPVSRRKPGLVEYLSK